MTKLCGEKQVKELLYCDSQENYMYCTIQGFYVQYEPYIHL